MNLDEIINKYIYIIKRDGSVKEILGREAGRTVEMISEIFSGDKSRLFIKEINTEINGVDVSETTDFIGYVKWINQKRPKNFLVNGKIRELKTNETYWGDELKIYEKGKYNLLSKKQELKKIENEKNKI